MGACDFKVLASGKTVQDAFYNAVDAARYEHGHDSYNGTISTTSLRGIDENAPKYGTKAFKKYLSKRFDTGGCQKWDAWAVELKGKALKEYRTRHGLQRKRIRVFLFYGVASC